MDASSLTQRLEKIGGCGWPAPAAAAELPEPKAKGRQLECECGVSFSVGAWVEVASTRLAGATVMTPYTPVSSCVPECMPVYRALFAPCVRCKRWKGDNKVSGHSMPCDLTNRPPQHRRSSATRRALPVRRTSKAAMRRGRVHRAQPLKALGEIERQRNKSCPR